MLANKTITLLISGSIAAYKSAEIVRELKKSGATVRVAMSEAAQKFITPLCLQTLSCEQVHTDLFSLDSEREIGHIDLADSSDLIVSAPASANLLAKSALGFADDLLSTVLLAAKCPVLFFPAMNINMWNNFATKENVAKIRKNGRIVIEPSEGELACGWIGSGRLPDLEIIMGEIESVFYQKKLKGKRIVIAAGPTQEAIDPVRFISNHSSGKMGYALADVCKKMGADVVLVSGPTSLTPPRNVEFISVATAEEMHRAVLGNLKNPIGENKSQGVIMAAAISDHRPKQIAPRKLKKDKTKDYSIDFEPCADTLATIGQSRAEIERASGSKLFIIGFAAENFANDENSLDLLVQSARQKLDKKKADIIVGNFTDESFKHDSTRVWIFTKEGEEIEVTTSSKKHVAFQIVNSAFNLD